MKRVTPAILLAAISVSACQHYELVEPRHANSNLNYLPWGAITDRVSTGDTEYERDFLIKPGMRLDVGSAVMTEKKYWEFAASPLHSQWVMPGAYPAGGGDARYAADRSDYLFLSTLLLMSVDVGNTDEGRRQRYESLETLRAEIVTKLENDAPGNGDSKERYVAKHFLNRFSRAVFGHLAGDDPADAALAIGPLRWRVSFSEYLRDKDGLGDATALRRAICGAAHDALLDDGAEATTVRELVFGFGTDRELSHFGGTDWFFKLPTSGVVKPDTTWLSDWFRDDPSENKNFYARADVDVKTAFRFESEIASRFTSPCTTIADLETQYGVEISGVRRAQALVGNLDLERPYVVGSAWNAGRQNVDTSEIQDSDGYVTLIFEGLNRPEITGSPIWLAKDAKSALLIGHGDVVLLNGNRIVVTDQPALY